MGLLAGMCAMEYHQITRTADRTRLAVQVRGTGPALLILPGQANNHHWWDRIRADFAEHHTTITFDYRGTGGSDLGAAPYTTQLFADDALAVLDSLDIDRFDAYGTSMGGRTAQWVAARAQRRVGRLVLGCTTPGGTHAVERDQAVRRALASANATAFMTDLMYTPEWQELNPGPYATLGDPRITPEARRRHLAASNGHDAWAVLPDIAAPTFILHGSDDRFAPVVNAEILAGRIPKANTRIFDGARHAYFDECHPEAGPAVLDFLAR